VGRHLCDELDRLNTRYLMSSRDRNSPPQFSKKHFTDLTTPDIDWEDIRRSVSGIIHLAAAVPHSPEYPDNLASAKKTEIMDTNILNLQGITKAPLIYISTCGLYSKETSEFHMEEDLKTLVPASPYFAAKSKGEEKVSKIDNATVVRLSAPVSPTPKRGLVLEKMIRDGKSFGQISVYGQGTREQDFISLTDTTSAILKLFKAELFGVYNLCSSRPVTMHALAKSLSSLLKIGTPRLGEEIDPNDGAKARYSNLKLRNSIDWNPMTSLDEIIATVEMVK
jgi:nucleoside-diphosphate-sugar epimerase